MEYWNDSLSDDNWKYTFLSCTKLERADKLFIAPSK
jgi:hypothetical protein